VRDRKYFSALAGIAAILSGCVSTGLPPKTIAPASPAAAPPLTAAQLLEPLSGGLIGGNLGAALTPAEKQRGLVAEYQALETSFGQAPVVWVDDKTGSGGEVIAGTPYRVGQQDCRPFSHKLTRKTIVSTAAGSACRQTNGSWLLLK
jgi:surface antigen